METSGKRGRTNSIPRRSPKTRERDTAGKQRQKATTCRSNIPNPALKSFETVLISRSNTPISRKNTDGLNFSMSEASGKVRIQHGSRDSREKQRDKEISLSPIDSARPRGSVESRMEIDRGWPKKGRGLSVSHRGTMLIEEIEQISDEISSPPGVSKGGSWKLFSQMMNAKSKVNENKVRNLSLNQLIALGKEIDLDISPECSIMDRQEQTLLRLEWLGKRSILKAPLTSAWAPPMTMADRDSPALMCSVNSTVNFNPEVRFPQYVPDPSIIGELRRKFEVLKTENSRLLDSLEKSESLRLELERRVDKNHSNRGGKKDLEIMRSLRWTRDMSIHEDSQAGLWFDLEKKIAMLRELDANIAKLNHASRDGKEWPVAIVSEKELETVSYPINNHVHRHLGVINDLMKENINMTGHMVIPSEGVEVTAGFAGAKGNLIWFNTGNSTLLLRLDSEGKSRSILLKPGFGFCLGKRKSWVRVYLSSPERADALFNDSGPGPLRAHAIFFGSERGDEGSWRYALNCDAPAKEPKKLNYSNKSSGGSTRFERDRRLGVELQNNRRSYIRIAPSKDNPGEKGFLSEKINSVEKWIKNTLSQAKLKPTLKKFTVTKEIEYPQVGEPFEVLWVKFEFGENMWNEEVMWDIRYLLMGSKMGRLPGFPYELSGERENIYISRDGDSERMRRARRL